MTQKQAIDLAAFEAFIERPENADRRFELIGGEIVEKMPPEEHSLIAGNTLDGGALLPGFTLKVADIFRLPK